MLTFYYEALDPKLADRKTELLAAARADAKMAKYLLPTWYRPYVRLAKILVCKWNKVCIVF